MVHMTPNSEHMVGACRQSLGIISGVFESKYRVEKLDGQRELMWSAYSEIRTEWSETNWRADYTRPGIVQWRNELLT